MNKKIKMEQKFLMTNFPSEVQRYLDKGWRIISVTTVHDAGRVAVVLERNVDKVIDEELKSKLVQPKYDSPFGN